MARRARHRRARFVALVVAATITVVACSPLYGPPPTALRGTLYYGNTFDACTAPTVQQMSAWRSTFGGVGVYIGGANRACGQPQLTPGWIGSVKAQNWHLLPLYVGLQAPCISFNAARIDPAHASQQGIAAANDAANQAQALGLGARSPIFFDMEAYGRDPACIDAVRSFVNAWVYQLHQRGYVAGLYSSSASGMADQDAVYNNRLYRKPDVIWFANWDGRKSVFNDPYINNAHWANHQRHHQYQGGHDETHGGVTINIDRSLSDGSVAA